MIDEVFINNMVQEYGASATVSYLRGATYAEYPDEYTEAGKANLKAARAVIEQYKERIRPKTRPFTDYKRKCWHITNQQPIQSLPDHDKRGWRNYHLDHIVSIFRGFHDGISPEKIGNIKNLRMIPHKDNIQKGRKAGDQWWV